MTSKYDFGGWATRNDLQCSDGRTIRRNAFIDNDGQKVPLVWAHMHQDPENVLGHCVLENREDGVYAWGKFNNTKKGKTAKEQVLHGDLDALSIYANQLKQNGGDVLHGTIREVSLVLAGANPGAYIDSVIMTHSMEPVEDEGIIYTDEQIELLHSDNSDEEESMSEAKDYAKIFDEFSDEQKELVHYMVGLAIEESSATHNGVDEDEDEKNDEIVDEDDEDEEEDNDEEDEDDDEDDDEEGEKSMKHNVFENDHRGNTLSHDDMKVILKDAKTLGSLKESVEAHMKDGVLAHAYPTNADGSEQKYGIADIDYLFPEARNLNTPPEFIKRDTGWVPKVINGTHHTPFSRIKSMFANITEDEARAKGYIKGKLKKEEVFTLLKRTTDPQTIYKKQKMDRDDQIDITDFDVVSWIKAEMRMMLDEELARSILIGDGRSTSDDDHISEEHIRPIYNDADLYTVKVKVNVANNASESDIAKAFIRSAIKSRKEYKGSGNPTLFTTEDMLADMLLIEDGIGHLLYPSEQSLATTLRVSSIVTVPVMENAKDKDGNDLVGIIVNLSDYNVGADKGGAVSMFEDFDIDYNQMKYLIETRCSGALIKPYSAMAMSLVKGSGTGSGD